jgi:DNA-binding CsgD family transcriptional regulator
VNATAPQLDPRANPAADARIDELLAPLRTIAETRLDIELGERLRQIVPASHCLCVLADSGGTGLALAPLQLHGSMHRELQGLYSTLIGERDPLAMRARQEWRPLVAPIDQHAAWVRSQVRHADTFVAWLHRNGASGASHLAVVPARGRLTRGTLFVFSARAPVEAEVLALFYAAQRLAVTLELRHRPFIAELMAMRFSPREADVLRAGLKGSADEQIAAWLGLSVDAIRYYFKKFKHRVPPVIGHMKPRDLARILHQLDRL